MFTYSEPSSLCYLLSIMAISLGNINNTNMGNGVSVFVCQLYLQLLISRGLIVVATVVNVVVPYRNDRDGT